MKAKKYTGYTSYSYLEVGKDYRAFTLAREIDRELLWLRSFRRQGLRHALSRFCQRTARCGQDLPRQFAR